LVEEVVEEVLQEVGLAGTRVGVPCTSFLRGDFTPTRRRASARSSLFRLRYFLALAVSFEEEKEDEKEEEAEAADALPCPAEK
jgi:hypothetical protein